MLYVYVLRSKKDGKLYIGKTRDLRKRLEKHSKGDVPSTKTIRPLELIYYEAFIDISDWSKEELFLKSGVGKEPLKQRLLNSLLLKY